MPQQIRKTLELRDPGNFMLANALETAGRKNRRLI
jgi:hypothetical protein